MFLVAKTYYYCKVHQNEIKYMKYMEEKCYQRSDEWGDEVLLRLVGVQNDIVAADERYHKDCKSKFYLMTKYDDEKLKEVDRGFLIVTKKVSRKPSYCLVLVVFGGFCVFIIISLSFFNDQL